MVFQSDQGDSEQGMLVMKLIRISVSRDASLSNYWYPALCVARCGISFPLTCVLFAFDGPLILSE